jgi:hypothetical protein
MIGPILDNIIQYLGPSAWKDIEDAKQFRAEVRKAVMKEESGWGWLNLSKLAVYTMIDTTAAKIYDIQNLNRQQQA